MQEPRFLHHDEQPSPNYFCGMRTHHSRSSALSVVLKSSPDRAAQKGKIYLQDSLHFLHSMYLVRSQFHVSPLTTIIRLPTTLHGTIIKTISFSSHFLSKKCLAGSKPSHYFGSSNCKLDDWFLSIDKEKREKNIRGSQGSLQYKLFSVIGRNMEMNGKCLFHSNFIPRMTWTSTVFQNKGNPKPPGLPYEYSQRYRIIIFFHRFSRNI